MDTLQQMNLTMSQKIITHQNPQNQEIRCRICYDDSKTLITLCQCAGTIAYVHQECILDWITKKMENSSNVQIPKCQICRSAYSDKIKIGNTRVCFTTLFSKIKNLGISQIVQSCLFIFSMVIILLLCLDVFSLVKNFFFGTSDLLNQAVSRIIGNQGWCIGIFKGIVFPILMYKKIKQHFLKRMKLWEDSIVQIVELTLNPKKSIKR